MDAAQLDYVLPPELIAQDPPLERDGARLLSLERGSGRVGHRRVRELPELLPPSLIVVNDTRVIPARLHLEKDTGGRIEFLLVERLGKDEEPGGRQHWLALGQTRKGVRVEMRLHSADGSLSARVLALRGGGEVELLLEAADGVDAALDRVGSLPLPPYIRRSPAASDWARYQTVFARHAGAVAAPTAGLHLSEALLEELHRRGHELAFVTLHVGPGTFAPLRAARLSDHPMHAERFVVPELTAAALARAKREGRPVLAVGTTVVRTLEAAAAEGGEVRAGSGRTALFIYPPFEFRVVDALLTNFHLPRSTLLALVMAFGGEAEVRRAYAEAIEARYRFFSYGDAMLIRGAA
jgi:S-adenosylmethionine:tRNA ribosyltransferase-isomerase